MRSAGSHRQEAGPGTRAPARTDADSVCPSSPRHPRLRPPSASPCSPASLSISDLTIRTRAHPESSPSTTLDGTDASAHAHAASRITPAPWLATARCPPDSSHHQQHTNTITTSPATPPPPCTAHTRCASRARRRPRRSRIRRRRRRRPSRAASSARALSVSHLCPRRHARALVAGGPVQRRGQADARLPRGSAGHAFRKSTAGAFGPDLSKKLSQLVKMEKNVMRSMELVGKERMEVAVSSATPGPGPSRTHLLPCTHTISPHSTPP